MLVAVEVFFSVSYQGGWITGIRYFFGWPLWLK